MAWGDDRTKSDFFSRPVTLAVWEVQAKNKQVADFRKKRYYTSVRDNSSSPNLHTILI